MENELEPVAYINVQERTLEWATPIKWETPTVVKMDKVPLYAKSKWVGLTDDEKKAIYEKADVENWHDKPLLEAVEAKLKEKNASC